MRRDPNMFTGEVSFLYSPDRYVVVFNPDTSKFDVKVCVNQPIAAHFIIEPPVYELDSTWVTEEFAGMQARLNNAFDAICRDMCTRRFLDACVLSSITSGRYLSGSSAIPYELRGYTGRKLAVVSNGCLQYFSLMEFMRIVFKVDAGLKAVGQAFTSLMWGSNGKAIKK